MTPANKIRLASRQRIAGRVAATLRANRQKLLEQDLKFAMRFRDDVSRIITSLINNIEPGSPYPPTANYDGNMHLDIHIPNRSGVHRQMLLQVKLPADPFYQFAFGDKKLSFHDAMTNTEIEVPDFQGIGTPNDYAAKIIGVLKKYVATGGAPLVPHSNFPSPLTK